MLNQSSSKWNVVYEKLIKSTDGEELARVSWFLGKEQKAFQNTSDDPPMLSQLKRIHECGKDGAFKSFVKIIAEDTKQAKNNADFLAELHSVNQDLMPYSGSPKDQLKALSEHVKSARTGALIGLGSCWSAMSPATQMAVLRVITTGAASASTSGALVAYVGAKTGALVSVALASVYLAYDAIRSIRSWFKGEISGARCAKNIIDSVGTTACSVGGGIGGAALGTFFGPAGIIVGAILGGAAGAGIGSALFDALTTEIFDLPKDAAVEKAYRYLGVSPRASNGDVNLAHKRLCREYHPDKGGSKEKFVELQTMFSLIKLDRGEV